MCRGGHARGIREVRSGPASAAAPHLAEEAAPLTGAECQHRAGLAVFRVPYCHRSRALADLHAAEAVAAASAFPPVPQVIIHPAITTRRGPANFSRQTGPRLTPLARSVVNHAMWTLCNSVRTPGLTRVGLRSRLYG